MIENVRLGKLFVFAAMFFLAISCNKDVPVLDLSTEPADPDNYDMSVWGKVEPGLYSGFGSLDNNYSKSIPPQGEISESVKLSGWKGERVQCKLLVWGKSEEEQVTISAKDFKNGSEIISSENISISVMQYVLIDQFINELSTSCGPRDKDQVPVHLRADIISDYSSYILSDYKATRPVWISVDIPADAVPGTYEGTIIRKSSSGKEKHSVTLEVQDKVLPPPSVWPFHLDLWQNPFAVARYHNVELWSDEHIELLKPYLTMLAEAGQKCITATMIDKPWGNEQAML